MLLKLQIVLPDQSGNVTMAIATKPKSMSANIIYLNNLNLRVSTSEI